MVSTSPSSDLPSSVHDQLLGRMSCSDPELNPYTGSGDRLPDGLRDDDENDDDGSGIVRLNVGGRPFDTTRETLQKFPHTLLGSLSPRSPYFNRRKQEYFFDRNSTIFEAILDLHRNTELHIPHDVCGNAALRELRFWRVPASWVSECCWNKLNTAMLERQLHSDLQCCLHPKLRERRASKIKDTCRSKVWAALSEPRSSTAAMIWNVCVVTATLVTVTLFAMDTRPEFREKRLLSQEAMAAIEKYNGTKLFTMLTTKTCLGVWITDVSTLSIMVAEFFVKLLVCPNLKFFLTSFFNIVYGCSLLACCLAHGFEFYFEESQAQNPHIYAFAVLRGLHFTRLLRILDLLNSHPALRVVWIAFMRSRSELLILLLVFAILAAMLGALTFYCELYNLTFACDVGGSVYWAVITMATVGYGDLLVTSACGRMVAVLCSLLGMVVLAIPVAVLTQRFHMYHAQHAMHRERFELRRRRFRRDKNNRVDIAGHEWASATV